MTCGTHVYSRWLGSGSSEYGEIGPVVSGPCLVEIHRANTHGSGAAGVNLDGTLRPSKNRDRGCAVYLK